MNTLTKRVLVLNKLWQAINLCSVRRAICFLYTGLARVVEPTDGAYETYDFPKWLEYSQDTLSSEPWQEDFGENGNGNFVHTVSYSFKSPSIIILSFYSGYPNLKIKLSRENIYKRDKYTCQYCGRKLEQKQLNLDHIIPRHRGGKTSWTNVVSCCFACNLKKGGKTLQEIDMRLLKKPRAPFRYPLQNLDFEIETQKNWSHFLDFNKWNVEIGDDREPYINTSNLKS